MILHRCPAAMLIAMLCLPMFGEMASGQTVEGDALRGGGAFLHGLGWYNVSTAKGNAINVDATIRWQRELRRVAEENRAFDARRVAGKAAQLEEVKRRQLAREQQLRTNPSSADIVSGAALNVLLYDLSDPDFSTAQWNAKPVPLPSGMSVKDLTFQFMPLSASSVSSKALSRGVIALSRLEIHGKWPIALNVDALESERVGYETAYAKVHDQVLAGNLSPDDLLAMDRSIDSLRAKAQTAVPKERGFLSEATRFVDDLKNATRMFDASTVDYAKEMLLDTQDHDAKTVYELVGFMLKFRLQFANTERNPSGRVLSGQLYEPMSQQLKELAGVTPTSTYRSAETASTADDSKNQTILKALQGEWLTILEETNEDVFQKEKVIEINRRIRIKDNSLTMSRTINGKFGVYDGHFEIDAKTGHFDWSGKGPGQNAVQWIGIFNLDGDRLKLCYKYVKNGTIRPTTYKTSKPVQPGEAFVNLVLKRVR